MLRGYIRPEPRLSAAKQRAALEKLGVKIIYEEALRKRGDGFPQRDALLKSLRKDHNDVVAVSHFHRLATDMEDLAATLAAIFGNGFTIIETETGRRSSEPKSLSAMIFEASQFFAQRGLTPDQAAKIGRLGAMASPATKTRDNRKPLGEALTILSDMALSITEAVAVINKDKRYSTKYSLSYVYRMRKKGKLPFPDRPMGPKIKPR